MGSRQATAVADPDFEWVDDGANYLLRLDLKGFRREDFSVYVRSEGLLTVIAQRKPAPGGEDGKTLLRLHEAFQLPNTANLDAITGRFDGTTLTLTVPKLPAAAAPSHPAAPPQEAKDDEARVAGDKPADQEDKAAEAGGREAERATLTAARSREERDEKAEPVAPPPPSESARGDHEHRREGHQNEKARRADDHREEVAREAARRIEAARARVAEAKAKAERERKCEHWKDRAMEEGLKLAEAINKNKEAIATAVAAFTLGVFVSSRLFSRN